MGSNKIAFLGVKISVNLGNRLSVKKTLPEAQRTDGATCISCKFGHQMAPLALVLNLAHLILLNKMATIKGILHQKIFYRLNLIFWIVMGCGIADFDRRGL